MARDYYLSVVENVPTAHHMSLESAEVAKIGLNATIVTKMGVANELAWLCHAIPNSNAQDVLGAIGADSRIGHEYFSPGTWPGGPCFPRDTRALAAAGRRNGMGTPIARQVSHLQKLQLSRLADLIEDLVPDYPRVGILGLTYKPGVDIMEESQGMALAEALEHVANVGTHDPSLKGMDVPTFAQAKDLLVLMTCWPEYKKLEKMDLSGKCVVDMWGFLEGLDCKRYVRFGCGS
jgi:UDPglucose 6-dehydrogenase